MGFDLDDLFGPSSADESPVLSDTEEEPASHAAVEAEVGTVLKSFSVASVLIRLEGSGEEALASNDLFPTLCAGDRVVFYRQGGGPWTTSNPRWVFHIDGGTGPESERTVGSRLLGTWEGVDREADALLAEVGGIPCRMQRKRFRQPDNSPSYDLASAIGSPFSLRVLDPTVRPVELTAMNVEADLARLRCLTVDPETGESIIRRLPNPGLFFLAMRELARRRITLDTEIIEAGTDDAGRVWVWISYFGVRAPVFTEHLSWRHRFETAHLATGVPVRLRPVVDEEAGRINVSLLSPEDPEWKAICARHPPGQIVEARFLRQFHRGALFQIPDERFSVRGYAPYGELTNGNELYTLPDWMRRRRSGGSGDLDEIEIRSEVEIIGTDEEHLALVCSLTRWQSTAWETRRISPGDLIPVWVRRFYEKETVVSWHLGYSASGEDLDPSVQGYVWVRVAEYDPEKEIIRFDHAHVERRGRVEEADSGGLAVRLDDGVVCELDEHSARQTRAGAEGLVVIEKLSFGRDGPRVTLGFERKRDLEVGQWTRVRVLSVTKGGLTVDLDGLKAFLPASHCDLRPVRQLDRLVGETVEVEVQKITRAGRNVVVSRKAVLKKRQEELARETMAKLREGAIVEGTVKNITDYGCFIHTGGIDGLLHINDMTWGRIKHPSEMLAIGDEVKVVVLKIDAERARISLGLKQLSGRPWDRVPERYAEGQKVKGRVVSLVDYGAFVELEPGIEGLIHISEMSWTQRIKNPSKLFSTGDEVEAVVLDVDTDKQRIALGTRQLTEDPWAGISARYPRGSRVRGPVRSITNFGIFVSIEDGIDCLVHVSELSWGAEEVKPSEIYSVGDEIEGVVLDVEPDQHRFTVSVRMLQEDPWATLEERCPAGSEVAGEVVKVDEAGAFVRLEENVVGLLHPYETTRAALASVGIDRALESGDRVRVRVLSVDKEERTLVLVLAGGSHAPPREAALSPAEAAPSTGLQERVPGATAAEEESAITSEDVEKSPEDKEACAGESAPASEPTGPAEASTDAGAGASKLYRYYDDDSFDLDGEDAPEDIDDDIYLEDEDEDEDELTGLRDEDGLDLEAELGDLLPMALSGQASMAEVAEVARQVGYYALATLAHCTSGRGSSNEVRGGQTLPRWRVGAAMAEIAARRPCSTADSPPSSDAARPTDDTDMTLPRDLETALRALFSAPDDPLAYTVFGACVPSEWLVAHRSTIEELIRSNAHPSYRPWIPGLRVVEARAASGARRLIAAHRLLNEAIDEGGRRTVMRERNELVGRFPDALDQEQVFSGADGTFTRDLAHNITLGSFAAVIPVKAADTEVRYALKHYLLLDEGSKKMEESLGLFEREATMLARVGSHPNIVNYYGRLAPGMILLEWIPGDTLAHALQARIPGTGWPAARCMDLAFRVASAIHRLESEFGDFVHHDLAPRNIMVDERSTEPDWVKIIDLGLARSRSFSTISTAIREINVRRRKDHWPPEWVEGARPAAQGDMYALGLVVLEALGIGEPLDSLRGASPDELARLDPGATGLSTPGWRALQHLLARRPEERPGTWKTVMDELEEALDATA